VSDLTVVYTTAGLGVRLVTDLTAEISVPLRDWMLLICLLVVPASLSAAEATLTIGSTADARMTQSVLDAGVGLYHAAVKKDELRGAVLLVARNGVVVVHEAIGWRDFDRKLPMERDSLFRMASNTKPLVASAILMLVEEGKLDLDDPVHRYLPAFDTKRGREITIRQLLSHTAGLRIPTVFLRPLLEQADGSPTTLQAEVNRFGEIGAEVPPGTSYSYNNPGYNTLGAIVEVIEQAPLADVLKRRFYQPLGMTDSAHRETDLKLERMCCVYKGGDKGWTAGWKPGDAPDYPFVRGSGGLISTAWDYAHFLQMYLNGGSYEGRRYLSARSVAAATAPRTREVYSPQEQRKLSSYYGLGWMVSNDGVYSHSGSDGTFAWVDPRYQVIGIVLTQSPGGKNPRNQFVRIVRGACVD
jgi:CubicO group peptidase (beta-lactamase class C family)